MRTGFKFGVSVDETRKVIAQRVSGDMPGDVFNNELFAAYAGIREPWRYHRLFDFRKFTHMLTYDDILATAKRWAELTEGIEFHSKVAVVSLDPLDIVRVPTAAPLYPRETLRAFNDFDEAIDWLAG